MEAPSINDYVKTYFTLYEQFEQEQEDKVHYGHPFDYATKTLILFFTIMLVRRIHAFKAQQRWLVQHPDLVQLLGFETTPERITLSRRFKQLYPILQPLLLSWASVLRT